MHVAQVSFFMDPAQRAPEELLTAWPTLVDVAECAARPGPRVSVIQASNYSRAVQRNGVSYYFLPFGRGAPADTVNALGALLRELQPDVFHVHGLGFPQDVLHLSKLAPATPIILQDHADRVPRLWHRPQWRRCHEGIAGVAFCSGEQAIPFVQAGLLGPGAKVYEIPESTTRFNPGDQEQARRTTGVRGDPLVLWVGHLNENKDPLAVLEGVSLAARSLAGLEMYFCFGNAPLLPEVRRRIAKDRALSDRVHLLGRVPHGAVQELMRAADIYVSGSHREGSGYSLIEALACGLSPVVTDIPSFRSLTGAGAVGMLWPPGNPRALADALLSVAARAGHATRVTVRSHFESELSFDSLGSKLAAMYEDALGRKLRPGAAEPPVREVVTSESS